LIVEKKHRENWIIYFMTWLKIFNFLKIMNSCLLFIKKRYEMFLGKTHKKMRQHNLLILNNLWVIPRFGVAFRIFTFTNGLRIRREYSYCALVFARRRCGEFKDSRDRTIRASLIGESSSFSLPFLLKKKIRIWARLGTHVGAPSRAQIQL
jgi:hypothetical protein